MPDPKLVEYIEAQVKGGIGRTAIRDALLKAGWPSDDVNRALISLAVPFDTDGTPKDAASAPEAPKPAAPAVVPAAMPAKPIPSPAQAAAPAESSTTALPGIIALVKEGWGIYRNRFATFASIGALQLILQVVLFASMFGVLGKMTPHGYSALSAVAGVLFFVLIIGLMLWTYLASYIAAFESSYSITMREALGRAWKLVGSYVWVSFASMFVVFGALALYVGLPALVVVLGAVVVGVRGPVAAVLGIGLIVLAVLGAFVTWFSLGTRILFAPWLLLDSKARGLGALAASRDFVAGRFGAVLGRFVALMLLFIVVFVPAWLLTALLGHYGTGGDVAGAVIQYAYTAFFLTPLMVTVLFSFYSHLRSARAAAVPAKRGWYIALAWLGVVGLFAIPASLALVAAAAYRSYGTFESGMNVYATTTPPFGSDGIRFDGSFPSGTTTP